jgi:hypothetical protein
VVQEHEFQAMSYSVIAAAPRGGPIKKGGKGVHNGARPGQQQLQLLKVGRFLNLASDNSVVTRKRLRAAAGAGVGRWGAPDGWDGVLLPRRKPRRRLAGWAVEGGVWGSNSEGEREREGERGAADSEEEEFQEEVFLSKAEAAAAAAGAGAGAGAGSSAAAKQQQQQQQQQQHAAAYDPELDPRHYSDAEDDASGAATLTAGKAAAAQAGRLQLPLAGAGAEDRPLPGGGDAPFAADLQQVRAVRVRVCVCVCVVGCCVCVCVCVCVLGA